MSCLAAEAIEQCLGSGIGKLSVPMKLIHQVLEPLGQLLLPLGWVGLDAFHDVLELTQRGLEAWYEHDVAPLLICYRGECLAPHIAWSSIRQMPSERPR